MQFVDPDLEQNMRLTGEVGLASVGHSTSNEMICGIPGLQNKAKGR